jgi:hypothetical protein
MIVVVVVVVTVVINFGAVDVDVDTADALVPLLASVVVTSDDAAAAGVGAISGVTSVSATGGFCGMAGCTPSTANQCTFIIT